MRGSLRTSERTCCICRSKGDKQTLIRLVASQGKLVVDEHQRLPGRGGYVHPTVACVSRMAQVSRWERALRVKGASFEASQVSQVVKELMTRVGGLVDQSEDGVTKRERSKKVRL